MAAAEALGEALVARDCELVFGGGNLGLMGAVARTVDAGGKKVTGVIPRALADPEVSGSGVTIQPPPSATPTNSTCPPDVVPVLEEVVPGGEV